MELSATDQRLLDAVGAGLPLEARPYQALAEQLGSSEAEVIARLAAMQAGGIIKRLGVIVRHHELGYRANAMVVWNIPDERVMEAGTRLMRDPAVTLCYQRPRRPPHWHYNLFCMIHGRARDEVLATIGRLADGLNIDGAQHEVLFSTRRYKQRGASYGLSATVAA